MKRFQSKNIPKVVAILREEYQKWEMPAVTNTAKRSRDPFRVLISTILSLRTKDETTREASKRLFKLADNPGDMLGLSHKKVEEAIYPVGFYKTKTTTIREVCRILLEKYDSEVPAEIDELLNSAFAL